MNVYYISSNDLKKFPIIGAPKYGYSNNVNTIWIDKGLPNYVARFIREHEAFHIRDKSKNWLWREVKANTFAAICHPLGFVYVTWHTIFSLERIKYYIQRVKTKK